MCTHYREIVAKSCLVNGIFLGCDQVELKKLNALWIGERNWVITNENVVRIVTGLIAPKDVIVIAIMNQEDNEFIDKE